MKRWLIEDRDVLDALDDQLLELLARRAAHVGQMAERKRAEGLPLRDPERERVTLARWRKRAEALGLDPELAERVARDVIGAGVPKPL